MAQNRLCVLQYLRTWHFPIYWPWECKQPSIFVSPIQSFESGWVGLLMCTLEIPLWKPLGYSFCSFPTSSVLIHDHECVWWRRVQTEKSNVFFLLRSVCMQRHAVHRLTHGVHSIRCAPANCLDQFSIWSQGRTFHPSSPSSFQACWTPVSVAKADVVNTSLSHIP